MTDFSKRELYKPRTAEELGSIYGRTANNILIVLKKENIIPCKKVNNFYLFDQTAINFLDWYYKIKKSRVELEVWHIYESRMNYDPSV